MSCRKKLPVRKLHRECSLAACDSPRLSYFTSNQILHILPSRRAYEDISLLAAGLMLCSACAFAGDVITNDTDEGTKGLRVVFSAPVLITAFGDVLTTVDPQMLSYEFVFSGGIVEPWGSHWFNYTPVTASIVEYEWLTEIPMSMADIAVVSHSEIATVFEVELAPSPVASALRYVLIDDFDSSSPESRFAGTYQWDADAASSCEVSWISDGVSGGQVLFDYVNRSWLKVGLWGFAHPLDAAGFDGIEITLWSDEPVTLKAEIGAWNEADQWIAYICEGLSVDGVPRTFRVPFDSFSPYNSSSTGVSQAHLQRVIALAFFPGNEEGSLYIDEIGLYGEDPPVHDASDVAAESLKGTITRYVSNERIPFTIRYEGSFTGTTGLEYHWEVGSVGKSDTKFEVARADGLWADSANLSLVLTSNSEALDTRLSITDATGRTYEWLDPDVDIPLHNLTEITLDATQFVPEAEIAAVTWTARNGDPDDAQTFPIADPTASITTLVSQWPNVLDISCMIEKRDGSIITKDVTSLVYFRDGTPFKIRSTAATVHGSGIPTDTLADMLTVMFPRLRELGFNSVTTAINWWYGYPDADGGFNIHPIYNPNGPNAPGDPRGETITPDQLQTYLSIASQAAFPVNVEMRQFHYRNDSDLAIAYHQSGFGTYAGFRNTEGFLFGGGEGYENMLLHYLPVFKEFDVTSVFLGAENGQVEAHGGVKTREFYQAAISAYRGAGFDGALSYAAAYFHNPDWPDMPPLYLENLDPVQCGITWNDMDYIGLTFYPKLTDRFDAVTREMYEEALRQIDDYLRPLHETYSKPLFIEDMYCFGHDGCAIRPVADSWRFSKPYDPEEQRRWHTALLRAFARANCAAPSPWIAGITMYTFSLDTWLSGQSFRERAMAANLNAPEREDLRLLAKIFFRDVPLEY